MRSINTNIITAPAIAIVALFAGWTLVTEGGFVPGYILPSPIGVAQTLVAQLPAMIPHVRITMIATLVGLVIAVVTAVVIAFGMAILPPFRRAVYPLLVISQTIPLIALAPLFVMWFGFGVLPKVLVVALVCFFPVVVSLIEGINAVDTDTIDLLRSMGAGSFHVFTLVQIPSSIPYLFGGLRIAATYSVMGAVIGEWLGGASGLGVYMLRAQKAFSLERVFAAIFVIVILSFTVFGVIVTLQRIATPWRRSDSLSGAGSRL